MATKRTEIVLEQHTPPVVSGYLDLLDAQREAAFAACEGLSFAQIWQRPAPGEWSIGEILNHNCLVLASFFPMAKFAWKTCAWYGRKRQTRPYITKIEDVYRRKNFPMWVGFLWTPKYGAHKPVSLEQLKAETLKIHGEMHTFYTGKDEAVLGNVFLYDPVVGVLNLITTLRVGVYHDQLHYEDVIQLAQRLAVG
jgi:hypothetical protein